MRFKKIIFLFITFITISSAGSGSPNLLEKAWDNFLNNKIEEAQKQFEAVIAEDETNISASIGLYYIDRYRGEYEKCWNSFKPILSHNDKFQPYLYSALSPITVYFSRIEDDTDIIEKLEDAVNYPDKLNILPAMIKERLAAYYSSKSDDEKCSMLNKEINPVTTWKLIGPFDNISASGFEKKFPPESKFIPETTYTGKNGVPVKWFDLKNIRIDNWIDFTLYFAYTSSVYYANTFVYSPVKQNIQLRVGTSGSLKAFVNDFEVYSYFDENNNDLDTYIVETELNKGWNRILIKCGYSEIDRCNFFVRITDTQGSSIDDLKISKDSQDYKSASSLKAKIIPNFAEEYFKNKIEEEPEQIENYLLLADCYSRNDKAIEAELILLQALKKHPDAAILLSLLTEAYQRGEKFDEYETTIEKLYSLDKKNPLFISSEISDLLDKSDFDAAEKKIDTLKLIAPEFPSLFGVEIGLYAKKGNLDRMIELSKKAFEEYPGIWEYAYMEYTLKTQLNRDMEGAVEILDEHIKANRTITPILVKANTLLQMGKVDEWEKTYNEVLKLEPAGAGYYLEIAKNFYSLQNYDKAETYLKKAIDICPNSSKLWTLMGDIYTAKENTELAVSAFKTSLIYNHSNYDARTKLRELQGRVPVFNHFTKFDIDSLVSSSPSSAEYKDESAVILLDKFDRVVYEEGASEYVKEFLVRVFNSNGIERFKEYYIPYNSYSEGLYIEKAVVIKKDGSEIPADTDKNYIVFKSLEPNDCIYIKWNVKNYYNGKLSDQFWDEFYFSSFYRSEYTSYSILIPEDEKFNYSTLNMDGCEPEITNTDDGKMYRWTIKNEPAVNYEYNMPGLNEVGKVLYISSLKDWKYLVDWYKDITYTKTRPSYEIQETVQELFDGSKDLPTESKIKKIYEYITDNIQYSSVPFRQSAFIPQSARDVLVTKIGDCKDLATLCIAMLKEIGVEANYVLVNTKDEGLNENILPSIAFNHAIVSYDSDNGPVYLDLTARNYPYAALPEGDRGAFSLLIKNGTGNSMYLESDNILKSVIKRETSCKIEDNQDIILVTNTERKGATAGRFRENFRFMGNPERVKMMAEDLSQDYPNVVLNKFETSDLENKNAAVHYTIDMTVPGYVNEAGDFKMIKIPWTDNLQPLKALSYDSRVYPFTYWSQGDTLFEKIEINLQKGYQPVVSSGNYSFSYPGGSYKMSYSTKGNKITGERCLVFDNTDIRPDNYQQFREFYNNVIKTDSQVILLQKK